MTFIATYQIHLTNNNDTVLFHQDIDALSLSEARGIADDAIDPLEERLHKVGPTVFLYAELVRVEEKRVPNSTKLD